MSASKPTSPIRLGFIGLSARGGWASSTLAAPLFEPPLSSKYHVVAISTSNPSSAAESAKKYSELGSKATGKAVAVKQYNAGSGAHIAEDPEVDMVAVAIRTMMHKEQALKVIEAGKNLFLEWPAGRNAKETEEIYEAAKKKGVRTMVGTQFRSSGFVRKVKSLVDSGKIGRVLSTMLIVTRPMDVTGMGKYTLPSVTYLLDGAGLLDIFGGHALEMMQYVLGLVASLTSTTFNPFPEAIMLDPANGNKPFEPKKTYPQTIPTQIVASGLLRSNCVFTFHNQAGVGPNAVRFLWLIDGEEGSIRIEEREKILFAMLCPEIYCNGERVLVDEEMEEGNEDRLEMVRRAWDAFAEEREGEYPTIEDALRNRRVVDAIKYSGISGERIILPK